MVMRKFESRQPADQWTDSGAPGLPWLIDLSEWLCLEGHYGPAERSRILTSILDHGTLVRAAESGLIDPEDYALLEAIFVESQPAVSYDDPAWDCPDTWELGAAIPPGAVLTPPELEDLETELNAVGLSQLAAVSGFNFREWRKGLGLPGGLPPISGGAPAADRDAEDARARLSENAAKIRELEATLTAIRSDTLCYNPY